MGALAYITFKTTNMRFSNTLSLMMSIIVAGISYLSCILIFKVDELNEIIAFYKNRRKNRWFDNWKFFEYNFVIKTEIKRAHYDWFSER